MTTVQVDSWAAGGRGLGRVEGRVWMVAGAVPGDLVEAEPTKVHERWVEAAIGRIVQPSVLRRPPPCTIQSLCGGCPMMPVDEGHQRSAKRQFIVDALARIGRLREPAVVEDVIAAPPVLGYRNKIELTFGAERGAPLLGYHRADRPSSLVDVSVCTIADPRLQPLLAAARSYFLEGPGRSEPALVDPRDPLRLVLRASVTHDERMVALRGLAGPFASAAEFARRAHEADPGLAGVVRLIAAKGRRGGTTVEPISGRNWIGETILGTSFQIPAQTFLQVHPAAAELLGSFVLAGAGSPADVIELYGGIGALGLAFARRGVAATIVDADAAAIACGAAAAEADGLDRARFRRADVQEFLEARRGTAAPALVIADPPRTGLGRGVAESLARMGAPRLAMISCDPATLARDLAGLTARGYVLDRITPFDLFPQTAHVEAVAWLRRAA